MDLACVHANDAGLRVRVSSIVATQTERVGTMDHSLSLQDPIFLSLKFLMSDGSDAVGEKQKKEIAKWFLANAPAGEIQYFAKDVRSVLGSDDVYELAAAEAFPAYNKAHLIALEMPDRSGDIIISPFGEVDGCNYFDPRTAQVATVDHVKQVCTKVRPATDDELPSSYIEEFRNGSCRSIWIVEFKDDSQVIEISGKLQIGAHYYEEGNVQLAVNNECKDSTIVQSPEDSAIAITTIIRHHEAEYTTALEASYLNLPDTTFKDLRRKLPVTRTLFPWHNTLQFSLTRDITKELGIEKGMH